MPEAEAAIQAITRFMRPTIFLGLPSLVVPAGQPHCLTGSEMHHGRFCHNPGRQSSGGLGFLITTDQVPGKRSLGTSRPTRSDTLFADIERRPPAPRESTRASALRA